MKRLIALTVCIALIFIGCAQSNEHCIFRSGDMITIYWAFQENAEIANFELSNNILELDIDTDELQEKQSIPINFVEDNETLEITGMSRLDNLAIFHIVVNPLQESIPELPRTRSKYMTYRGSKWSLDDSVGDFTKAESFRSGDRVTVYWRRAEKIEKAWHNWTKGNKISDKWMESRELPDGWMEALPLPDMDPQDWVLIGFGITPEICIAYFRIFSDSTD